MIENLLPHSADMILVDEIIYVDKESIKTKSVIKPSPFIRDNKFYSYQLIEIMAQSLGLYRGSLCKERSTDIAFLVGSRKFEIFQDSLNIGDCIYTESILSLQDEFGFGVYDSSVFCDEKLIARARLSVLNPSKEKFLELKNG